MSPVSVILVTVADVPAEVTETRLLLATASALVKWTENVVVVTALPKYKLPTTVPAGAAVPPKYIASPVVILWSADVVRTLLDTEDISEAVPDSGMFISKVSPLLK